MAEQKEKKCTMVGHKLNKNVSWSSKKIDGGRAEIKKNVRWPSKKMSGKNKRWSSKKMKGGRAKVKQKNVRWGLEKREIK
jgi:hypothetical protein